ncbi:MAG: YggS family pyridoxal phosphate-dependent enzyme [Pseudomonadota bacterium]
MIAQNIQIVKEKIIKAAHKAGRSPENIKLVAVSKRFSANSINEALAAGQLFFGENYIQEVQTKRGLVPAEAIFHFIGHLQSNKAKIAAETCDMIETVDSFKLGKALNNQLESLNKSMDILIQVNISNDPQKAGVTSDEAEVLLHQLSELKRLRVCGLMTIPPLSDDPERSRRHFRNLRILAEICTAKNLFPYSTRTELSMGMSDDFHIAIEEGATIVRVGTAIFGDRL